MSERALDSFLVYRKSVELFHLVVDDMATWMAGFRLDRLVSQQLASADSVCANIEEGYGRETTKEYRRYLIIARGSLRETEGRYRRLRHWIPQGIVTDRLKLSEEIGRMLSAAIVTLEKY